MLHKDLLKQRARGEGNGWRIKRLPDPVVTAQGVLLPDFKLTRDGLAAYVLLGQDTAPRMGLGANPFISRWAASHWRPATFWRGWKRRQTACSRSRPACRRRVPSDVRTLCDQAAKNGMVRAADARRVLHLLDESPLIEWVRLCEDPRVRYIPGVGLCSQELVAAIQGDAPQGILTGFVS